MISAFFGIVSLEYLARTRTLPSGIRRLEAEVEKSFPDAKKRLEWHLRKAAELEAAMIDNVARNEVEKGRV
jgi:hypothetical protein